MLHQLSLFRSTRVAVLKTPGEILLPNQLPYLQQRNIDVWLIIQAALADAIDEPCADGPMYHFHGILRALAYRSQSLANQGYVMHTDPRYMFTENDASVVSECFTRYFDYFSAVLINNSQLLIDLKSSDYRLFLTDTSLILDY